MSKKWRKLFKKNPTLVFSLPLLVVASLFFILYQLNWNLKPRSWEEIRLDNIVRYDDTMKALLSIDRRLLGKYVKENNQEKAEKARKALAEKTNKIIRAYEDFLSQYPSNARALNYLGLVYCEEVGNEEKAYYLWKQAIKAEPQFPDAHNNLGTLYADAGNPLEAIREFHLAIKLNPQKAAYYFNLANTYFIYRNEVKERMEWSLPRIYEVMMSALRKCRELEPHNLSYAWEYAQSYHSAPFFGIKPEWEKALEAWNRCLELTRDRKKRAAIYLHLGRIYMNKGELEKAIKNLNQSLALYSTNSASHLLKRCYLEKQDKITED